VFSNFTEETCTGTGATLALAGVTTGNIAFSKSFADGDLVAYVLEDSGGTIKVAGVGTYVSATDDITRNDTWNWNGTVIDDNPSTNITLSGGTHTIRCDVVNNQLAPVRTDYLNVRADSQYVVDAWSKGTSITRSGVANRLWVMPFMVVAPVTLSGMGVDITSLSTTNGNIEIGLYDIDYSANTFTLIDGTGTIDGTTATGTTGYNTSNFSGGNLTLYPNKPVFAVLGSDGTPTTRGLNHATGGHPYMPCRYDFKGVGIFVTSGWSAGLPSTISAPGHNNTQTSGSYPNPFGVKA